MGISPGDRWKRKQHDGTPPERPPHDPSSLVSRRITVAFHPMRETTLVTVVTTNLQGHDRWDRKDGTLTVDAPIRDLAGRSLPEVLAILLRAALEELDR
jgi:hypothetical protein